MSNILLAFSFILHIITILIAVVLFQRQSIVQPKGKDADDDSLFDQLELYTERIEQGNHQLIAQLKEHLAAKQEQIDQLASELDQLKITIASQGTTDMMMDTAKPITKVDMLDVENVQEKPIINEPHNEITPVNVQDVETEKQAKHAQALELSKQGFSVDKIAQILNLGKGEVQLLLNMHQKQKNVLRD